MAFNSKDALFNSGWNIDQIAMSGERTLTVGASDVELVDFTSLGFDYTPNYIVAAKRAGTSVWIQGGALLRSSVSGKKIYVDSQFSPAASWTVRYYILNTRLY